MSPTRQTFSTLMAATDFSTDAREAVARAHMLATQHDTRLVLVHVVDPGPWSMFPEMLEGQPELHTQVFQHAEEQLSEAVRALRAEGQAIDVSHEMVSGGVVQGLLAASERAGVLVLGASSDHPIRDLSLGSTAEQLSRLASRPLLVARGRPEQPYRQVVAAVDFSATSTLAVRTAMELAPNAGLHLLHCLDLPYLGKMKMAGVNDEAITGYKQRASRAALNRLGELAATLSGISPLTMDIVVADIRIELLQQARAHSADLIAIGKQGQSLTADTLLGSTSASILADAKCDVLVVPARSATGAVKSTV